MKALDIVQTRLHNQRLGTEKFKSAEEVVGWMGAIQAQEYAMAKWGIAQRMTPVSDAVLEQAITDGTILRTHVLRPTWHFVLPADIRWMLKLTAPRIHALNAVMHRKMELDDRLFRRSNAILIKSLKSGKQLTRVEIRKALQTAGVEASDGIRFAYLLMHAELNGIICSGARRGKQFTYALLEERAPKTQELERDHALSELIRRYFSSRGPATLQDFAWWSGLAMKDAKRGIEICKSDFVCEMIDGHMYWFPNSRAFQKIRPPIAHLLPIYDEYPASYKNRSAAMDVRKFNKTETNDFVPFTHPLVMNGRIVGHWKRVLKNKFVTIHLYPFGELKKTELNAITAAARRYGAFLELQAIVMQGC